MCSFSQQEIDFEKLFHEQRELNDKLKLKVMQLEEQTTNQKFLLDTVKEIAEHHKKLTLLSSLRFGYKQILRNLIK